MLDLRRLGLLRELRDRGTIASVAAALHLTPSAVSQQLAQLERDVGLSLLERAGRGVRLTESARMLAEHADALLARAAAAEADLAAEADSVVGRVRIAAFPSAIEHWVVPVVSQLAQSAPDLCCEVIDGEPEDALPKLAAGDLDLVVGDEWPHRPWRLAPDLQRRLCGGDPLRLVRPPGQPRSHEPLARLAGAAWVAGYEGMAWAETVKAACREHGGFEPDIRHRAGNARLALALVAAGQAVTILPELALGGRDSDVSVMTLGGAELHRKISVVTRAADANRPSVQAVLKAVIATATR